MQISDEIYDTHQRFYFTPFNYYDVSFTWENIIYKEEKDISNILLKQKDHYNFGYLDEPRITNEFSIIDDYEDRVIYDDEIGKYTINIARMILESNTFSYLECSRKKNTFLDVIAKIGALFSTLNFFLSTFFSFYSKNFNNYKIIDKILNIKKERDKYIELSINLDNSIPLMKEEENKIKNQKNIDDINKSEPLIKEKSEKGSHTNNESKINYNIGEENDNNQDKYLQKLSFFDFFYNNIYFKFCLKNKKQEIIICCNEIIKKYLSIDSILINQIKLENLFKDYNWNNIRLNNIENNELIIKLKNLL